MSLELHKTTYLQEAQELIADIEANLLDIEKDPGNKDALNCMFRCMHTLKGSGAMFGFDNIAVFAHHLETVLEKACKEIVPVTQELADLILISLDQIKTMLFEDKSDQETTDRIVAALNDLLPEQEKQDEISGQKTGTTPLQINPEEPPGAYRIEFRPEPLIFTTGTDPLMLLNELQEIGHCMTEPDFENIPVLRKMTPDQCYLSWDITLITDKGISDIKEVFMFVEESVSIQSVEKRKKEIPDETAQALLKLCDELLETGFVTTRDFNETIGRQKEIGDLFVKAGITSPEEVKSGLDIRKLLDRKKTTISRPGVRVPLEKMDILVNLVGELIINQARLKQISGVAETGLLKTTERLTGELRNTILSIRMVPIETTFGKFRRYVRDTARILGKEIDLVTEGGDTELDKTVMERLEDPLIHLIRNSIDHGIEMPDEREKAGKPRKGTILISAAHTGSKVSITLKDDGVGIDTESIRAKAVEKGLIAPHAEMSEKEIYNILFIPGFSTSEQVTNISGRGVGMDIIKRATDSLQGKLMITSSKGRETVFQLSLPLTLAIIDGLLIDAGGNRFILPINSVDECVELTNDSIEQAHGRNMTLVRGELIPFIRLREIFDLPGQRPLSEQIAVVQEEGARVGIVADDVLDEHQTVVKSLGKFFQSAEGFSGATIMGDGSVSLILDIPGLIRCSDEEAEKFTGRSDVQPGFAVTEESGSGTVRHNKGKYLVITLGQEDFALEIIRVREVAEYKTITMVPRMPGFVMGVVNLRGDVVPVIDLGLRLGMGAVQKTEDTCIVIAEVYIYEEVTQIGMLVDSSKDVLHIGQDQISAKPRLGTKLKSKFIKAVGRWENQFMIILDIDKIIPDHELFRATEGEFPRPCTDENQEC